MTTPRATHTNLHLRDLLRERIAAAVGADEGAVDVFGDVVTDDGNVHGIAVVAGQDVITMTLEAGCSHTWASVATAADAAAWLDTHTGH